REALVRHRFQKGEPSLQSSYHDSPGPVRQKERRDRRFSSSPKRREFRHDHRGQGPAQTEHRLEFGTEILDFAGSALAITITRQTVHFQILTRYVELVDAEFHSNCLVPS